MTRSPLRAALLAAALAGACAPAAPPSASPAAVAAAAGAAPRAAPRPVPVPPEHRQAVARGTRSETGAPGPRYWQQGVSYRIRAELEPGSRTVRGAETIVYRNASPDTLRKVVLNLYQNLFTPQFTSPTGPYNTGGIRLERVTAQGRELPRVSEDRWLSAQPGDPVPTGYAVLGTLGALGLPTPLAPGDSAVLEVEWRFRVPPEGAPRTGWEDALGGRAFQVAQWYPQVAVYDDLVGHDATGYLGSGEFYTDYGDFDVELTLPAGWLVGATGVLQQPERTLSPAARERLARALRSDEAVRVVGDGGVPAREALVADADGRVTWRFRAEDVRDFAFAASDRYVWDAQRAVVPDGAGGTRDVPVHALYRPRARGWERAARYGEHSLELFSRELVPYLYPQITITEGPIYGMEYPMVVFIGRPDGEKGLYEVIAHEVGHEWFPMMVGQDEAAYPWMDEGLTTFHEGLAMMDFFPGHDPWAGSRATYAAVAGSKQEAPLMRHADQVADGASGLAAYWKPGLLMRSLRAVLGDSVYGEAMRTYAREWQLKKPTPWDFFNTFERVAGRDLDWFWEPWWFRTATLDQAVAAVEPGDGVVRVTVSDRGGAPAPTPIAVVTAGGDTVRAEIPVERWVGQRLTAATVTIPVRGAVAQVILDPEQLFLDRNRRNNVWRSPGR